MSLSLQKDRKIYEDDDDDDDDDNDFYFLTR
jgi:hypothetical protein